MFLVSVDDGWNFKVKIAIAEKNKKTTTLKKIPWLQLIKPTNDECAQTREAKILKRNEKQSKTLNNGFDWITTVFMIIFSLFSFVFCFLLFVVATFSTFLLNRPGSIFAVRYCFYFTGLLWKRPLRCYELFLILWGSLLLRAMCSIKWNEMILYPCFSAKGAIFEMIKRDLIDRMHIKRTQIHSKLWFSTDRTEKHSSTKHFSL